MKISEVILSLAAQPLWPAEGNNPVNGAVPVAIHQNNTNNLLIF